MGNSRLGVNCRETPRDNEAWKEGSSRSTSSTALSLPPGSAGIQGSLALFCCCCSLLPDFLSYLVQQSEHSVLPEASSSCGTMLTLLLLLVLIPHRQELIPTESCWRLTDNESTPARPWHSRGKPMVHVNIEHFKSLPSLT